MDTAQILRAAAARVRQGWCQHETDDDFGNVCAQGALCEVRFGRPSAISLVERTHPYFMWVMEVNEVLGKALGDPRLEMVDWNNAPDQTAENVAAGLEYAALIFEQEHPELTAPPAAESLVPCNRS